MAELGAGLERGGHTVACELEGVGVAHKWALWGGERDETYVGFSLRRGRRWKVKTPGRTVARIGVRDAGSLIGGGAGSRAEMSFVTLGPSVCPVTPPGVLETLVILPATPSGSACRL